MLLVTDISGHIMQTLILDSRIKELSLAGFTPGIYLLQPEGGKAMKLVKQ